MSDEHTFVLTFEASGEVTPAPQPAEDAQPDADATELEPEEAEQ